MTRLSLLLVGHVDPRSTHIAGDYPQLYQTLLAPLGIDVVPYDWADGQTPSNVDECDAWLCSPSRMSTYEPAPWLADVEQFLRTLIATEWPYIGICFGHQLLAQALGGRVAKAEAGWGVGVQPYMLLEQPAWACPAPSVVRLIASHQDQVVDMPVGARRWLTFRATAATPECSSANGHGPSRRTPSSCLPWLIICMRGGSNCWAPMLLLRPAPR